VRDGGGWTDPDTRLSKRPDGSVAPAAVVKPLVFSGGGSKAPLARLSVGDRSIELRWPKALPAPRLSGGTATYPEVLSGVDLELTAQLDGFSSVLVVKNRAAAADPGLSAVDFGLTARGLTVTKEPDGTMAARDEAGAVVFASTRVEMTDAGRASGVGDVTVSGGRLTVVPDQDLLRNPDVKFPVRIDPNWAAPGNAWTKVFSGHPGDAYWFGGLDGPEGKVGNCGWTGCAGIGVARTYFQFDTSALAGANVLGAEFNVRQMWSPDCTPRPTRLYSSGAIGPGTTWAAQPGVRHIATVNSAFGYSASCPANWVGFGVPANAIGAGGLTAFMLGADNEADKYQWKRFNTLGQGDLSPSLIVTYNWPPAVPASLWAQGGQGPSLGCPHEADRAYAYTGAMTLNATLSDRDGQNVAARFEWWRYGGTGPVGSVQTAAQAPGTAHRVTIPAGVFGDGSRISWRVQAWDGIAWSPFSLFCQVTVDSSAPRRPTVRSVDFPENGFGGWAGKTGVFQIEAAAGDTDVLGYQWSLDFADFPPVDVNAPTFVPAHEGRAGIWATPTTAGPHDLYVRAVDRALNLSEPYRTPGSDGTIPPGGGYHFLVGTAVPGPTGHWPLDGNVHAAPRSAAPDASPRNHPATVSGVLPGTAAGWTFGRQREALRLTGAAGGYASTSGSVVNTGYTFSVSAWVMLDSAGTATHTAVSQDGGDSSGFFLGYAGDTKRFAFRMLPRDDGQAPMTRASSDSEPLPGVWYHLTGVFDSSTKALSLYVNGSLHG
ncbi:LamG-like jellyroll fold domain-containing protein, partial [Actinoplanes sp. NPDC051633]|uniref:LamG-like jellyroll fold domain-containing protein n=1 Tax=Actinoplanes sp. NPDC051633 TaxID=3155670 RepID=UPI00341E99A3